MPSPRRRPELDELDRALVAALERDGRATNVELARRLEVSEKTIRARITRLTTEHGLVVTAQLPRPDLRSRMVYLVHTEPGRRLPVAELLAGYPEVERVGLVTGAADLMVTARFADDAAALRFQLRTVERTPGVRAVATCHVIDEVGGPDRRREPASPQVDAGVLSALMMGTGRHTDAAALDDAICDAALAGLGADRVAIAAREPGPGSSSVTASRGLSARYVGAIERLIRDGRADGVVKRVWETRLHMVVADALADPLLAEARDLVREEGYRALLCLPLLYGDSMLATVTLYWDRLADLGDAYLATAQSTVDHFAVAFARVRGLAPRPLTEAPGSDSESDSESESAS